MRFYHRVDFWLKVLYVEIGVMVLFMLYIIYLLALGA